MLSFRFLLSSVFFHTSHSLVVLSRSSSVSKQSLFVSFLNILKKWFNLSIEDNPSQPKPIIQLQVQKFFIAHHICMCCACKIEKQTNKIVGQFHLVKWCSVWRVWCMKTSFSSPQSPKHILGQHQYTAAIFCVVTFSCERLIHLLVVEKSVVSTIGSDFCFVMNCGLEWPGCGERNNTDTASWTVGYWRVSGAAELAVALAVTEGMNHHKNVCVCIFFSSFPFIYAPTYIVRETCVALNRDL